MLERASDGITVAGLRDLLGRGDFRCVPSFLCIFIFLPVEVGKWPLAVYLLGSSWGPEEWSHGEVPCQSESASVLKKRELLCVRGGNHLTTIGHFLPTILKLPVSQADQAWWNLPCQSPNPPEIEVCPSHQAPPLLPASQGIPPTPGNSLNLLLLAVYLNS